MRLLFDANAIVSFLYKTIVPHIEERLRYDNLAEEYAKASTRADAFAQNARRFDALRERLSEADATSRTREVDAPFASMRDAMLHLHKRDVVCKGLRTLYVSSKTARGVLDLVLGRLLDALTNDVTIRTTTDIPFEAMQLMR